MGSRSLIPYVATYCLFLNSCSDAQILLDKILGKVPGIDDEEYVPVPGSPSGEHLSKTYSDQTVGVSSQVAAMDIAIEEQGRTNLMAAGLMLDGEQTAHEATDSTFSVLQGAEKKKRGLDSSTYQKLDLTYLKKTKLIDTDYTNDTVNWGSYTDSSFTIPALDRMPVRDQGRRGTCVHRLRALG